MTNLIALLLILLFAGVLGGVMGFYLEQPASSTSIPTQDTPQTRPARAMFPFLVLGVGASYMVPLFLNMISSTLVSEALNADKSQDSAIKLLVILGFALIAAVSSRRFITSLTDKVIQDVQKAKELAEETEKKVDLIVEPENAPRQMPEGTAERHAVQVDAADLAENEKRVLRTLFTSTYAARALSGIWRDASIEEADAKAALDTLAEKSLVSQTQTFKGFPKWSLTNAGRVAASAV